MRSERGRIVARSASRAVALSAINGLTHFSPHESPRIERAGQALLGRHRFEDHEEYLRAASDESRSPMGLFIVGPQVVIHGVSIIAALFTDPGSALDGLSVGATIAGANLLMISLAKGAIVGFLEGRRYDAAEVLRSEPLSALNDSAPAPSRRR